jgi:YD repeat-containing protein
MTSMNTRRDWLLGFGLVVVLLLVGGAYLLGPSRQTVSVASQSPAAEVKPSVSDTFYKAGVFPSTPAPASSPPSYRYNAQGQLRQIVYSDGSVYSYSYDAYGDKIRETDRSGKSWVYVYDPNHRPIGVIDPEGHATTKQ